MGAASAALPVPVGCGACEVPALHCGLNATLSDSIHLSCSDAINSGWGDSTGVRVHNAADAARACPRWTTCRQQLTRCAGCALPSVRSHPKYRVALQKKFPSLACASPESDTASVSSGVTSVSISESVTTEKA